MITYRASLVLCAASLCWPAFAQCEDGSHPKTIAQAMNWYFRWKANTLGPIQPLRCTLQVFEANSFAYCEPGAFALDIESPSADTFRVVLVRKTWLTYREAITEFRRNRNPGQSIGPPQEFTLGVELLESCKVNRERSAVLYEAGRRVMVQAEALDKYERIGYPLVCEGDTFYQIIVMEGGIVEWVWFFEIVGDSLEMHWHVDRLHKNVPAAIERNVLKPELWYSFTP